MGSSTCWGVGVARADIPLCYWVCCVVLCVFFFFKQKTAYEIVSRDWSSDVCSSDLLHHSSHALRSDGSQLHR